MANLFLKGALVTFLPDAILPSVITFQLNPETVTHSLTAAGGIPVESFNFTLMLDSTITPPGSLPNDFVQNQLAALEGLLFATNLLPETPAALFCWGSKRVPVRVTALTVTEKSFDTQLNIIQAEAQIALIALTPAELAVLSAPMQKIATAAYTQLAQARDHALLNAQTVTDPSQSSGGNII